MYLGSSPLTTYGIPASSRDDFASVSANVSPVSKTIVRSRACVSLSAIASRFVANLILAPVQPLHFGLDDIDKFPLRLLGTLAQYTGRTRTLFASFRRPQARRESSKFPMIAPGHYLHLHHGHLSSSKSCTVLYRSLMNRQSRFVLYSGKRKLKDCCGLPLQNTTTRCRLAASRASISQALSPLMHSVLFGNRRPGNRGVPIDSQREFLGFTKEARSNSLVRFFKHGCNADRS